MEILNLNFKKWKYSQDYSLERVVITLLSKIVYGMSLFQLEKYRLVYWINVREWTKYTLTSQQFWKLTNNDLEWCNFKIYVTGCLSIMKYWLWRTLKEPFSSLFWFAALCYYNFFVILLEKLRCKIKIIAYNPFLNWSNYLLDLCDLVKWR